MRNSRRNFIRVKLKPGFEVVVGGVPRQAVDLSLYGISFLIGPTDVINFTPGLTTPKITFRVDGRYITVRGRTIHMQPHPRSGSIRVAAEFIEVSNDDIWILSRFLTETSGIGRKRKKKGKKATKKSAKKPSPRKGKPAARKPARKKKAPARPKRKTAKKRARR